MRRFILGLALVLLAGCHAGMKQPSRGTLAEPRVVDREGVAALLPKGLTLDTVISAPPFAPPGCGRRPESALAEAGAHVGADGKLRAADGKEITSTQSAPATATRRRITTSKARRRTRNDADSASSITSSTSSRIQASSPAESGVRGQRVAHPARRRTFQCFLAGECVAT